MEGKAQTGGERIGSERCPCCGQKLPVADIKLIDDLRIVLVEGHAFQPRPQEFDALRYLVANMNLACSREDLTSAVWPGDQRPDSYRNMVHQLISGLRRQLAGTSYWIQTTNATYRFIKKSSG